MTLLPGRRKQPRMLHKDETVVRCDGHLQWIRGCACVVTTSKNPDAGMRCRGKVQAAHVRKHGDGGTGMKPGDDKTFPACGGHHHEQHQIGEPAFERLYGLDLNAIAAGLWQADKLHRLRYEAKRMERQV